MIYFNILQNDIRNITSIAKDLTHEWRGNTYHIFRKNCISFVIEFAKLLKVDQNLPPYISTLMKTAQTTVDGYSNMENGVKNIQKQLETGWKQAEKELSITSEQITNNFWDMVDGFNKQTKLSSDDSSSDNKARSDNKRK